MDETPLNAHVWEDSDFDDDEEDEEVDAAGESNQKELVLPGPDPVTGENPPWAQNLPPLNLKKRVSNHHIIYPQPSWDREPRKVNDAMQQLSKLVGGPPPPKPDQRE